MKPFNLEAALNGAKVVTRDGREVTQVTKFDCESNQPVFAVLCGNIEEFSIDGGYYYDGPESIADLFMAEEETVTYHNVYPNPRYPVDYYNSIEDCIKVAKKAICVVKTTITPDSDPKAKVEIVHWYGQEKKQEPETVQIQAKDLQEGDIIKYEDGKDLKVYNVDKCKVVKVWFNSHCPYSTYEQTDLLTVVNRAKK